jgi:hypothetical protein
VGRLFRVKFRVFPSISAIFRDFPFLSAIFRAFILQFEKLLVMRYGKIKLTVGFQRSNQDLVQYCITVPQIPE